MDDVLSKPHHDEKGVDADRDGKHLDGDVERLPSVDAGAQLPRTNEETKRGLRSRHAQMIALGGTIGTGLFVGSGQALALGGPLFLLISYCLIAFLLYGIASATGEMSSYLPVPGCSVPYYANRFVSPSLGFAMGWMYWYTFAITVDAEITACALVIEFWNPPVNVAIWITISMVVILALNCLPVQFYGETEFWFASLKVFTIIGLMILTVVLFFGGGPSHKPLWFHNWAHPGPVNTYVFDGASGRFCAFLATIPYSFYAFAFAPELLVVTGGEMESPRRNLPMATRRYFYRLVIFYIFGAVCISIIVNSDNPALRGGSSAGSSPWAVGIKDAGIHVLDSIINACILISAWSAGNSYFYLTTRILYSMALSGNAPRIFARTTKSGIPTWATLATAVWMPLSYLMCSNDGLTVFTWLVNLSNIGGFESWICICIIYVLFRRATTAQNITDIPFRSRFQPYFAYVSGIGFFILMLISGFQVFLKGQWSTSSFLAAYIGIPAFALLYFGHKFFRGRHDPWAKRPMDVDLVSGLQAIVDKETPRVKSDKWYMWPTRILW